MSYASGTADNKETLLDLIGTFAAANGWTIDRYELRNTGAVLNMHKTGVTMPLYASMRSSHFERINYPYFAENFSGISVSMATGYDSGKDALDQPGAPESLITPGNYYGARVTNFNPVSKYWLFASSTPVEFLGIALLLPNGEFRHIIIGEALKYDNTVGKGAFFHASEGVSMGYPDFLPFEAFYSWPSSNKGSSYIYLEADERLGWWGPETILDTGANAGNLKIIGGVCGPGFVDSVLLENSVNEFSNASSLVQANLYLRKQDSLWAPFGRIPCLRYSRRSAYLIDKVYQLGTDSWMAFPCYTQNSRYSIVYKRED